MVFQCLVLKVNSSLFGTRSQQWRKDVKQLEDYARGVYDNNFNETFQHNLSLLLPDPVNFGHLLLQDQDSATCTEFQTNNFKFYDFIYKLVINEQQTKWFGKMRRMCLSNITVH